MMVKIGFATSLAGVKVARDHACWESAGCEMGKE